MMKLMALLLAVALSAPAATYYVTVAGLGGESEFEQRFTAWALEIDKILKSGAGDAQVETLCGTAATRTGLRSLLERIATQSGPQDLLVLMLIGHGAFDGVDYKINLPGPDISALELAGLLDRIPAARQLVVVMTSASGASIVSLEKSNRVVIAATKSGTERNATVFPRYWVEALRDPAADTDKNEVITALEAFRYADRKTAGFYESQKRLATEHPLLEDTGKGEGVRAPSPENGQGMVAGTFPLVRFGDAQRVAQDPVKRKLLAKREELEQQIDRLKYQRAALPADEYRKQLAALLLDLAKTQAELDK
jgi:hypothetical protein